MKEREPYPAKAKPRVSGVCETDDSSGGRQELMMCNHSAASSWRPWLDRDLCHRSINASLLKQSVQRPTSRKTPVIPLAAVSWETPAHACSLAWLARLLGSEETFASVSGTDLVQVVTLLVPINWWVHNYQEMPSPPMPPFFSPLLRGAAMAADPYHVFCRFTLHFLLALPFSPPPDKR